MEDVEREFYNELGGYRVKRSSGFYKNAKDLATQMTKTLDKLVGPNYDSRIRPNYGGKPVQVELNMAVTGMVITNSLCPWTNKKISATVTLSKID